MTTDVGKRSSRLFGLKAAMAVVALVTAIASTAIGSDPAVAQESGAPILTDVVASSSYVMDPCCFVDVEVSWAVDPSGPTPARYQVTYSADGHLITNQPSASATSDLTLDMPADTDVTITITACAGPVEAEVCDDTVAAVHSASEVEPHIEITELRVNATGPDRLQVTWDFESNIGFSYAAISITSEDPSTSYQGLLPTNPYTWVGAQPGSTYTVAIEACAGPTPSSVRCGGASTAYTVPQSTGILAGAVRTAGGSAVSGAKVRAYAPTDGIAPTQYVFTEADGTYSFYGLPEGQYSIVAEGLGSSGYALAWYGGERRSSAELQTVATGSTVDGLDLALPITRRISGVVTDGGVPVAGAKVYGYAEGDTWVASLGTTSKADGSFTLDRAEPGRFQIAVRRPGVTGMDGWYGSPTRGGATWVDVGSTNVTGIQVELGLGSAP